MASKFRPKFTSTPNYSFSNPTVKRLQASSDQTSTTSSVPIENQAGQMRSQVEVNNNVVNSGMSRTASFDNLQNANREVESRIKRITRTQSPTLPLPNYRINISRRKPSFGRTSNLSDIDENSTTSNYSDGNLSTSNYFDESSEDDKMDFKTLNDYKHETNSIHNDIILFVAFFAFIFIFYLLNQKREAEDICSLIQKCNQSLGYQR